MSIAKGKLIAHIHSITLAISLGYNRVFFESDNKLIVNAIGFDIASNATELGSLVAQTNSLLSSHADYWPL